MKSQLRMTLDDLKTSTLKRLVQELIAAPEGEEQAILDRALGQKEKAEKEQNDLADLTEEKRGKPRPIDADEEDT
jgi:hypothetical protein